MSGEQRLPSEGLHTVRHNTRERLQSLVDQLVTLQLPLGGGPEVTIFTRHVLLPSVTSLVHLQAELVRQLLPTVAEVLLVGVVKSPHVNSQISLPAEGAVTKLTGNYFLLFSVDYHVSFKRVALIESFRTVYALVRFFSSVDSQMSLQFAIVSEG